MKPTRITAAIVIVMLTLLAANRPSQAAPNNKAEKMPAVDTRNLVWPLPPDKPRVRYVGEFSSVYDIEPRKKRSWVDKMVGNADPNKEEFFSRPQGVAADSKGRPIIVSSQNGTVYVLDKDKREITRIRTDRGVALQTPLGLAVDSRDNLFISDPLQHTVFKFDINGRLLGALGRDEGLKNPTFLSIDEVRRRLYVVDSHLHQVLVYNLETLQLTAKVGKRGMKRGEFNFPVGIAVNPKDGSFAVTDTGSCSVQVFDADFKFVRKFGSPGTAPGQFTRPKGIAIDGEGNYWVVDAAFNNVQIFDPKGVVLMPLGNYGNSPGTFSLPEGIFIDRSNRVYVSDGLNHRVQIFQFLGGEPRQVLAGRKSGQE